MILVSEINSQVAVRLGSLWKPLSFSDPTCLFCINSAVEDLSKGGYMPANDTVVTVVVPDTTVPTKYELGIENIQVHWIKKSGVELGSTEWLNYVEYMRQVVKKGCAVLPEHFWTQEGGTWEFCVNAYPEPVTDLQASVIDLPARTFREWLIRRVMYYYYAVNKMAQKAAYEEQVCDMALARIAAAQANRDAGKRTRTGSDLP